jgi:flavin reductase (DIM6/NTAB) family NADH-FMN oxidoreductase RutF
MAGQDAFGEIMHSADATLVVVTTAEAGERAGCLVGFHAQSSMSPERYCAWLSKANHTYRVAQRSAYLAVHFLTTADGLLAERFGTLSGDHADKFAGLEVRELTGGVPVLVGCVSWLVLRRTTMLDEGGDHVCVTGEPVAARSGGPFRPLRVSDVGHLVPGHLNSERPHPPTERAPESFR